MIGCQKDRVSVGQSGRYHSFHAMIHCFNCFDGCFPDTRVTHHIRIGKVQANEVSGLNIYFGHDCIGNFMCTHFRLQVVGGYFGRLHHNPFFTFKWFFTASAEKETNVRVFFCFSNPDLFLSVLFQDFAQCVIQVVVFKDDMHVLIGFVILGHGGIIQRQFMHIKLRQVQLGEHLGNLTAAVSSEIKANRHIAVLYSGEWLLRLIHNHGRFDKLIRDICRICIFNCGYGICSFGPFSLYQGVISQLHPFPAFIPVHGIVTTTYTGNLTHTAIEVLLQFDDKGESAFRITVTSVCKGMDKNLFEPFCLTHIGYCFYMIDMRVHTAITYEPQEVQGFVIGFCKPDGFQEGFILRKRTITNGYINTLQFLVDDTTGAQIQVTYFRVTHLPVGQTYCFTAGNQGRIRVLVI